MEIKVIRSHKRRRTVSARVVNDILVVSAPVLIPQPHLEKIVANFKERFERKKLKEELNKKEGLESVAQRLNERYFENKLSIDTIEYVTNHKSKFGCCNYRSRHIRISHRISTMPAWVRDYVIIHELAHLLEPNHSKAFWDFVNRYELAERAKGYLMAVGLEQEDDSGNENEGEVIYKGRDT